MATPPPPTDDDRGLEEPRRGCARWVAGHGHRAPAEVLADTPTDVEPAAPSSGTPPATSIGTRAGGTSASTASPA